MDADDGALRAAAISLRDTGALDGMDQTLHPGSEDDYEAALSHQWGGPERSRWFDAAMARYPRDYARARGGRALVTGSAGGVGFFAAKLLAAIGLAVVLPARPGLEFEARGAAAAIRAALPSAQVEVPEVGLDLASFESVRSFAAHMRADDRPLDVILLNAARGGSARDSSTLGADGEEPIMQVNLLSHALLVRELLPALRQSKHARIVAHTCATRQLAEPSSLTRLRGGGFGSSDFYQYALSKAALCLYARALGGGRLGAAGVNGSALVADSGVAATGLNYQNDVAHSLGLSRRGLRDVRSYHGQMGLHAADAALPLVAAALEGADGELWLGESPGPRASSLDAAAHRAGHLLWPPLRSNDPMLWPNEHVHTLWGHVEGLLPGAPWPDGHDAALDAQDGAREAAPGRAAREEREL